MALIYSLEDDENISELILAALKASGYNAEGFYEHKSFFEEIEKQKPDLVLLDVLLPEKSGIDVLKELKGRVDTKNIPVIFLSAKTSELDKVMGLELGAEDYISKPFGVLELLARVKTALRRTQTEDKRDDFTLDIQTREVSAMGKRVKLTYIEFELLSYLYNNAGIALSRDKILSNVWGYDYEGDTTRTVDMHVRSLRQKLGDSLDNPKYIETIRGYGYRFIK